MLKAKDKTLFLILIVADFTSVLLGFLAAYFLRNKGFFRSFLDPVQPLEVYLVVLPFALILLLGIFNLFGLWEVRLRRTPFSEMYIILRATFLWVLVIMALSYLSKYDYSRIIVVLFYFFTTIFVILGRIAIRNLARADKIGSLINVAVIGDGWHAQEIAKKIIGDENLGFNFIGYVCEKKPEKKWLGKVADLPRLIKKFKIDEVYVTRGRFSQEEILDIVARCFRTPCKFKIISNIFGLATGTVNIFNLENIPSLDLNRVYLNWFQKFSKRSLDLVLSIILLILALPIALILALAIKLDSPGPVVIGQKRVGEAGKIFTMYKFRTMKAATELYGKAPKKRDDKRITSVGRFLRRISLDELPQLVNILYGEMSLVGPRPEMPFIVKRYKPWQKSRLLVKPGLTGLWQVLGRKDLPLSENLEYDFYYINNQSILLDLVIILKTIPIVLTGRGAY